MFVDIVLGGSQILLLWLKLTEQYSGSWWLVLMPSIVWVVIGTILALARDDSGD